MPVSMVALMMNEKFAYPVVFRHFVSSSSVDVIVLLEPNSTRYEMPYMENGDMEKLILKHGPGGISSSDMVAWFSGLLCGMSHMQDRYVMHRDIKPLNILFDRGWVPVLADFGVCDLIF